MFIINSLKYFKKSQYPIYNTAQIETWHFFPSFEGNGNSDIWIRLLDVTWSSLIFEKKSTTVKYTEFCDLWIHRLLIIYILFTDHDCHNESFLYAIAKLALYPRSDIIFRGTLSSYLIFLVFHSTKIGAVCKNTNDIKLVEYNTAAQIIIRKPIQYSFEGRWKHNNIAHVRIIAVVLRWFINTNRV